MNWYCVHVEHTLLTRAVNETFRNMLVEEFRSIGQPRNCHVYARGNPDGGYSYFFSPVAAKHFGHIIGFWEGVGVSEPTNLLDMDMIL